MVDVQLVNHLRWACHWIPGPICQDLNWLAAVETGYRWDEIRDSHDLTSFFGHFQMALCKYVHPNFEVTSSGLAVAKNVRAQLYCDVMSRYFNQPMSCTLWGFCQCTKPFCSFVFDWRCWLSRLFLRDVQRARLGWTQQQACPPVWRRDQVAKQNHTKPLFQNLFLRFP